jgi:hypothetical protein
MGICVFWCWSANRRFDWLSTWRINDTVDKVSFDSFESFLTLFIHSFIYLKKRPSWRSIFYLTAGLCVAVFILGFLSIVEKDIDTPLGSTDNLKRQTRRLVRRVSSYRRSSNAPLRTRRWNSHRERLGNGL